MIALKRGLIDADNWIVKIPRKRFPQAPRATPRRTLMRAAAAMVGVVAFGTVGIMLVEGWALVQSLFFTLITLTTVGYSDYDLSHAGRVFTIALMVGGLAVVTYSAGQLIPSLFNHQLVWERKMTNRILDLENHFIVCGIGRIGRAVCRNLAHDGVPFIAVDPNPEEVAMVVEVGHLALVGDATDDDVLEEAGIMRAKAIACVTSSDTDNIVITLSARELNPDLLIVSRAEEDDTIRKLQRAGATRVISPIRSGGVNIANAILKPNLAEFLDRTHDSGVDFELAEITVEHGSHLDGATVQERVWSNDGVTPIALRRPDLPAQMRPKPDERLRSGDVLIVAGDMLSIDALHREAVGRPQAA